MLQVITPIHFKMLTKSPFQCDQKSPDLTQKEKKRLFCFVSDPEKVPIDESTNYYSKLKYVILSVIVFGVILTIVVLAIKFSG